MKKQKLMILGAGKFQVPVIKLSKEMGFTTIVVSRAGDYPGFSVADRCYEVDVRETEDILGIAKKEKICGILTDQTDLPVPTVAYVAQELGLPGIGYDCALRITNKLLNRRHCMKINFPIPKFFPCKTFEEAIEAALKIKYPLIVKPTDSQGARGVAKVNHPDELFDKFQNALAHSTSRITQVEEFLPGRIIWVSGFISDYKYTNLLLGDSEYFDIPDMFVHKQSIHPAVFNEDMMYKVLRLDKRLFQSLGPRFGFTFTQYKINDETGDIRLIEAAIRSAAGFSSSSLIPLACGLDILSVFVELVTGKREAVNFKASDFQRRAVGNVYFGLPPGIIRRIKGLDQLKSIPGVNGVELENIIVGGKIGAIKDSTDTHGPIIFSGKNRRVCEKIINRIKKTFIIEVEDNEGIKGIQ